MINWISNNKVLISIILFLLSTCFFSFLGIDNKTASFDETFSIAMSQHSFSDIWWITSKDVHPPLYYFMLKAFSAIFGNSLIVFRLFSALGVILVLLVGIFPIRKYFGEQVSLVFVLLISIFPITQFLSTDIRMYSWCMFFVLGCALSAYRVYIQGKLINHAAMLAFAICAAYTHYFALLGVLFIYCILFGWQLYTNKQWKRTIISFILFIAIFSFWIPELYNQVTRINDKYWIGSLNPKEILLLFYYTFSPKEPSHPYFVFNLPTMSITLSLVFLLFGVIAMYTISTHRQGKSKKLIAIAVSFIAVFIFSMSTAIAYSLIIKPIIIPRYTTCYLACFVLGLSILLIEIYKKGKVAQIVVYMSMLILLVLSIARFFSEREYNRIQYKNLLEQQYYFEDKSTSNTVFMSPLHSAEMLERFSMIYPDNLYFIYSEEKTPFIFKPYICIEVNELPVDFDFFLVLGHDGNPLQIEDSNKFMDAIRNDFTDTDSLIQTDRKIYRMRTIHRERE